MSGIMETAAGVICCVFSLSAPLKKQIADYFAGMETAERIQNRTNISLLPGFMALAMLQTVSSIRPCNDKDERLVAAGSRKRINHVIWNGRCIRIK